MDPKELETQTPAADGLGDKTNEASGEATPKTQDAVADAAETVTLSKAELEKLQKKAADFDGIIEKNRIEKLSKKHESQPATVSDDRVAKLEGEVAALREETKATKLSEAYQQFVKEIPWAGEDEYFSKIVEKFSAEGAVSKDELVARLRATTISLFPDEYSKNKEKEIRSKILAEAVNINVADGSSGNGNNSQNELNHLKTAEEQRKARLQALLKKEMKWLNKD